MHERRQHLRKAVDLPLRLRVLRCGKDIDDMVLSRVVEARLRDLGPNGVGIESPLLAVDGVPLHQLKASQPRPRVFLQWELPDGTRIDVTAEAIRTEQIRTQPERCFQVGLRFQDVPEETRRALAEFLERPSA